MRSLVSFSLIALIKRLLPLSIVPVERPRNAVYPVLASTIKRQYRREREATSGDGRIVARIEFGSVGEAD